MVKSLFRRHVDTLLTKLILSLKSLKEYKANFYMMILSDIGSVFTGIIFFMVFLDLTEGFIFDWQRYDFILFSVIAPFSGKLTRLFSLMKLKTLLLRGTLNSFLTKPISVFIQCSMTTLTGGRGVSAMIMAFVGIVLILNGNYTNHLLAFCVWLFGYIYMTTLYTFFATLTFFFKGLPEENHIFATLNTISVRYTPRTFKASDSLYLIITLLPVSTITYFVVETLRGNFNLFLVILPYVVISLFVFMILDIILWRKGMRRYEAFG